MTPAPNALDAAVRRIDAEVERHRQTLLDVSHQIWAHPELCFEEYRAHALCCDVLEGAGLEVTRGAHGLPTGFRVDVGTEGPVVVVCCEYDALPDLGHACGHNVIAAAGIGAGIAASILADELGGRLRILGTPAEEGGGGKVFMLRDGAFDGVDAAMMVHPADHDLATMRTLAIQRAEVVYEGRASHAAAAPHLGRNALDAAVLGYVNVAALRQHIRADERIHGIFTEAGEKPNIVPRHAAAEWYVRAGTTEALTELQDRVLACLSAGADAAGCAMSHVWHDPPFEDLVVDTGILARFERHARATGRAFEDPSLVGEVVGSTDMGNVSKVVPSIHPMLAVAPPGVSIHTPEFAEHARGPAGDQAVLDGARAMAATVADLWIDPPVPARG